MNINRPTRRDSRLALVKQRYRQQQAALPAA